MAWAFCDASPSSSNSDQIGDGNLSFPLGITKDCLLTAQIEDLYKVMDLLAIEENHARTLLIHHRWNLERIWEAFERKGKDRLFSDVGIAINNQKIGLMLLEKSSQSGFICNICFDEFELSDFTSMDCGHYFCNSCWTEHFITSINNNQAKQIRCMSFKCRIICTEKIVHDLTLKKSEEIATRFTRFLSESYINDNDRVKWCPSTPHCGRAIRIESISDPFHEIECVCGTRFCFNCSSENHSPCSCRIWIMWMKIINSEPTKNKKITDSGKNLDWIAKNAKVCPKCGNAVIKEIGCNHVKCQCGQYFCWLCGNATGRIHSLDHIEGHTCNRYAKALNPNHNFETNETLNLDRYSHYYERYRAHADSLQKETKALERKMQTDSSSLSNWILNGFEMLVISRRVLCYTYPFAYFMFGDELADNNLMDREIAKGLFEDQQQQLECFVEKLAMQLENIIDRIAPWEISELRFRVVNLSNLLDKCCKDMYECIQEELLPNLGVTEFIAPYMPQGLEKAKEFQFLK